MAPENLRCIRDANGVQVEEQQGGLMFQIALFGTNLKNNRFLEVQKVKEFASEYSTFSGVKNSLSLLLAYG